MSLDAILDSQAGLITRCQALCHLTPNGLAHRLTSGRWRRIHPRVYAGFTGKLTWEQRCQAALLYAGQDAVLTAESALRRYGAAYLPADPRIHVLIPMRRRLQSRPGLRIWRRARPLLLRTVRGLPTAPPARALSDWAREQTRLDTVRAVASSVVQRGLCTPAHLQIEVQDMPQRGSALLRRCIEELDAGVRSIAEGQARTWILTSAVLPEPLWNPRLFLNGLFLADPDGYWHEAGLVHEVDSIEWHLNAADAAATSARRARITATGLRVASNPPSRWRDDGAAALQELESAYLHGLRGGPAPGLTYRSRHATPA